MATKLKIERNSQIVPHSKQEIEFLLLGATTKSNMAAKHEIEWIPLRAHHRQEVELSMVTI